MRYVFQAFVMLGDIALFAAVGYLIARYPQNLVIYPLIFVALRAFYRNGAFVAWQPKNIKLFLANAKRLGL